MQDYQDSFMLAYEKRLRRARSLLPLKIILVLSIGSLVVIRHFEGDMGRRNPTSPFQLFILVVCGLIVLKSIYGIWTRPDGVSLFDAVIVAL
jgi:hypothetical protein